MRRSGGGLLGLVDGTEQFSPGLIEAASGFIIADGVGDGIQLFEGEAGFEVVVWAYPVLVDSFWPKRPAFL